MTTTRDTDQGTDLQLNRRAFVQVLGTGLLITVAQRDAVAQRRRYGQRSSGPVSARVHVNVDGTIQVMTGKVEEGQGSRAELTQAAAEELRAPVRLVQLIMADTQLVPDDGITAGSRTSACTHVAASRIGKARQKRAGQLRPLRFRVMGRLLGVGGKVLITVARLSVIRPALLVNDARHFEHDRLPRRAAKENLPVAKNAKSFGGQPKVLATSATGTLHVRATRTTRRRRLLRGRVLRLRR